MRPDRIIIGECRGPEALDMLQAMNTGHEGSLTTVHANDTREALGRLEIMVGMAGLDLPIWVIRRQIASAIHIVVQVSRLLGGARKVVKVSEVLGLEGDNFTMHDIFAFKQTGVDANQVAQGYFHATGVRPHCLERLASFGLGFRPDASERRIYAAHRMSQRSSSRVRSQRRSEIRHQESGVRSLESIAIRRPLFSGSWPLTSDA